MLLAGDTSTPSPGGPQPLCYRMVVGTLGILGQHLQDGCLAAGRHGGRSSREVASV
jgi:hypothetical protein